jgi:hypothetical protein
MYFQKVAKRSAAGFGPQGTQGDFGMRTARNARDLWGSAIARRFKRRIDLSRCSAFIAYAKANPSKINMGSSGSGSVSHVFGEVRPFVDLTAARLHHPKLVTPAREKCLSDQRCRGRPFSTGHRLSVISFSNPIILNEASRGDNAGEPNRPNNFKSG